MNPSEPQLERSKLRTQLENAARRRPQKALMIAQCLFLLISLSACKSQEQTPQFTPPPLTTRLSPAATQSQINRLSQNLVLDASLSTDELGAIAFDFSKIDMFQFSNPNRGTLSPLDQSSKILFGSELQFKDYLFKRIKQFAGASSRPNSDPRIVATNLSAPLWLNALNQLTDPRSTVPRVSSGTRDFEAPNLQSIGLIVFGKQYGSRDDAIFRIGTLIHEARHSDCPNGLTIEQVLRIQEEGGPEAPPDQLDADLRAAISACGFMHTVCPAGHELAGLYACESGKGWGAYAAELAFFSQIARNCTHCSELEIQQAIGGYTEISGRVTQLNELLSGSLGTPETGENGVVE